MDSTERARKIVDAQGDRDLETLYRLVSEATSIRWPKSLDRTDVFYEKIEDAGELYKDLSISDGDRLLYVMLCQDYAAEETSMSACERVTCYRCRSWADHEHRWQDEYLG